MSNINNKNLDLLIGSLLDITGKQLSLQRVYDVWIKKQQNDRTKEYYTHHLGKIVRYLESTNVKSTENLTMESIQNFINFEHERGIKNKTINKATQALKYALTYCKKHGYLHINPLEDCDRLKEEDFEQQVLPLPVIRQIREHFDRDNLTDLEILQKALVYLALDTGARRNELAHIELKKINLHNATVRLTHTKNGRHRTQYMLPVTVAAVQDYIRAYKPTKYLFEYQGEMTSENYLHRRVKELESVLDLPEGLQFSLHVFRHTFATYSLMNGANLKYLKDALGHSSIQTTIGYTHLVNKEMQETHLRTSIFAD